MDSACNIPIWRFHGNSIESRGECAVDDCLGAIICLFELEFLRCEDEAKVNLLHIVVKQLEEKLFNLLKRGRAIYCRSCSR